MSNKVKIITLTLLFLVVLGIFGYSVYTGEESVSENLPRMILTAASYILVIFKIATGNEQRGRNSLAFYEKSYRKEIGQAFYDDKNKKKRLLEAIRLYNENKYDKALKMLEALQYDTYSRDDRLAVALFMGLCYMDSGQEEKAYMVYRPFVDTREATDSIYINCGYLMQKYFNDEDKAIYYYEKAAQLNTKNDVVCNNIADMAFSKGDMDKAIEYATRALEINDKRHEAASLLAIIYSKRGDKALADKYFHMAVVAGQDKKELKNAIEYYSI